jgi:NAD(P)-dependent dehydrogenase (short-subunit alcohol dehydrogenase family)
MHTKIALVTGGSRGIGAAIAVSLANCGYDVAVNFASNADAAAKVVGQIDSLGRKAIAIQANIAAASDRTKLLNETLGAFGQIDLLVNNAGVAPTVRKDILEADEESFRSA